MAYNPKLKEEEIKNKVAADLFPSYDCTRILGDIDFCVQPKNQGPTLWETESLLWAEAKNGVYKDITPLFAQLVLTIGGEKTFEKHSPPPFLGAFDSEKIAFLPWHEVLDLFFRSDIDWTATPSKWNTPAFQHVLGLVRPIFNAHHAAFFFSDPDLAKFAKKNLVVGATGTSQLTVTRNNFPFVYQKWVKAVKPSIAIDWALARDQDIHDADFFLADLLSKNNTTLLQNLFVVLRHDHYDVDRRRDPSGLIVAKRAVFSDGQKAHTAFWNQYRRPPRKEFWTFINDRRDLLMPPDIRERQGSFFTPQIWVEKAQEAIAEVLGENWQDEYDVWDPAGGTGNLLAGLDPKAKHHVWLSTLQQADVDIVHERIANGAALFDNHVFQFDFLNDPFDKLPSGLQDIVKDTERRKKLVVFLNPPYAEATTASTVTGTGQNKPEVAKGTAIHRKYRPMISAAANEMFALFLIRIAKEIPGCVLAQFSTLKHILGSNFKRFRDVFDARLEKAFVVPAKTFDNVDGEFPIGFFVWRTASADPRMESEAEVFNAKGVSSGMKRLAPPDMRSINRWAKTMDKATTEIVGYMENPAPDLQNNKYLNIANTSGTRNNNYFAINADTLIPASVYFASRLVIEHTWLNDRDQFLWPLDTWKDDWRFQLDCVTYALFQNQNRISCKAGVNHWIPFTEDEVGCTNAFVSHFMSDFLRGKGVGKPVSRKTGMPEQSEMFPDQPQAADVPQAPYDAPFDSLSPESRAVFDAGRELWCYYHAQPGTVPDASLYDIRGHFQGFKPNGHMNADSTDAGYNMRRTALQSALKALEAQIAPKIYEHGFLRR